ncbi:MucBP domain-containing protein [Eupransor demetentiae]|uniref:Class I (ManA) n=1 Tax=Eupransor demetentiae TaxID=3109584 RepID=A0ABP0EQ72_9LACO|nr:Mannose-6-phosphate isomerase [Lactobacillaceae bacterium LMG 33000]
MLKDAAPLWLYCRNISNNTILYGPKEVQGQIGERYRINQPNFDNYRFVDATGELSGVLGNHEQSLTLYYCPATWAQVQRILVYLEIQKELPVYSQPSDDKAAIKIIPAGSKWLTRLRVTTDQHEFWYQIGNDEWLQFESGAVVLKEHEDAIANQRYQAAEKKQADQQVNAIIDFLPEQLLDLADEPYGKTINQVPNGDYVMVDDHFQDENEVTWCHIKDLGWANGIYVRMLS